MNSGSHPYYRPACAASNAGGRQVRVACRRPCSLRCDELAEDMPLEAAPRTFQSGHELVAEFRVKSGRLEIEAVEAHADAIAGKRDLFGFSQQDRAEPLSAQML